MKLKSYIDYVNEASLEGNSGVPASYLGKVEREAGDMLNRTKRERPQDIQGFMRNVRDAHRLQSGHEDELEIIAEECIREFYGSILDNVTLNIRFPKGREIQNMMEEPETDVPDRFKAVTDTNTIKEIEKRKILKNITQGEAKNSKLMLNLPEVRDRILGLMGDTDGRRYLELLNKITEVASFFDWDIPIEIQKEMWERSKDGFAGSVDVSWKNDSTETPEELSKKILDSLVATPELPTEAHQIFNTAIPTIDAYGRDFAMLIHEAIKGIYQLIISLSIPGDPDLAETIIMNTDTLADELEDLRYGPKFAADLRDFINTFPEADQIVNLREHVIGKLSLMPAEEFLQFMLLFLNDDPKARAKMAVIIKSIQKDLSDYEIDSRDTDSSLEQDEDEDEIERPIDHEESNNINTDLSNLPDPEIIKLMDKAIDDGNKTEYERLAKFLKESRDYEFE